MEVVAAVAEVVGAAAAEVAAAAEEVAAAAEEVAAAAEEVAASAEEVLVFEFVLVLVVTAHSPNVEHCSSHGAGSIVVGEMGW